MSDWEVVEPTSSGSGDGEDQPEHSVSRQSMSTTTAEDCVSDWPEVEDDEADSSSLPSQGSSTQPRVQRDCEEIELMLDSFCVSDRDFGGGTRIWLRVGWPVKKLLLSDEQCAAWGLDNEGNLMVELRCPPHYFSSDRRQISVHVGLCFDTAMPRADQPLAPCRLSWPLENAIRTHFLPQLPPVLEDAGYELVVVQDLVTRTDCDFAAAIKALQATGGDKKAALQRITRQRQTAQTISSALLEAKEADDDYELVSPPTPSSPPDAPSTPPAPSAAAPSDSSSAPPEAPAAAVTHVQVEDSDDEEKLLPLPAVEGDAGVVWLHEEEERKELQAPTPLSVHARLHLGASAASSLPTSWPDEYPVLTQKQQAVIARVPTGSYFTCTPFMARRALEFGNDDVDAAVQVVMDMQQLLEEEESMAATATDFSQIVDQPSARQPSVSSPPAAVAVAAPAAAPPAGPAASGSLALIPSLDQELVRLLSPHNLLVRLLSFTWRQVQKLPSSCANCGASLRPGLSMRSCGLATCKLSIDSNGVDKDVIEYMIRAPAVADLLISMLAAAVRDQQLPAAVSPLMFSVRDPEVCYVESFACDHDSNHVYYRRLSQSINELHSLPLMLSTVEEMGEDGFVIAINSIDLLIIPLLRWLFLSCPAHLRLLETQQLLWPYLDRLVAQFAFLLNSPEQERRFQQRKAAAQGRTCLAYYTAPANQWHMKLRLGLTAKMANGGLVESGADDTVLLSLQPPDVTDFTHAWQRSSLTVRPAFVCEVELLPSARSLPRSPGHVAARQEDFSTRRLFVIRDSGAVGGALLNLYSRAQPQPATEPSPSLQSESQPPPKSRDAWDD